MPQDPLLARVRRSGYSGARPLRHVGLRQGIQNVVVGRERVARLERGLDDGEVAGLLHCVDAVLALGDVRFDTVVISTVDDDGCKVANPPALTGAAAALGCDRKLLERGLTLREIRSATVALSAESAADARDALAKELYSRVFDKVVALSNAAP